jgi:outer membrane protein assembly factor BamB
MNINIQSFTLERHTLEFDLAKNILRCVETAGGKILWLKQLDEIAGINSVSEDNERFFLSCWIDEASGRFIALFKDDGVTSWLIPGREYLHVLYKNSLFLIFVDNSELYYFLKINAENGVPVWQRTIEQNLCGYGISETKITLNYESGKTEYINSETGERF